MDIVKVSVKAGKHPMWVRYFDSIPTLEKLKVAGRWDRNVFTVLNVANPVLLSRDVPSTGRVSRWCTPILVAGIEVGSIDYKKIEVEELENDEQVKGFRLLATNANPVGVTNE